MFTDTPKRKYYPFLDGLRAFAALWVLLFHADMIYNLEHIFPNQYFAFFLDSIKIGHLGVDCFFVLSGFLITGLLIDDLETGINIKRFYLRRFFKIEPQYLTTFVIGFILMFIVDPLTGYQVNMRTPDTPPGQQFLHYFLFLQNYTEPVPLLAHMWSLSVEEHFYLCYPLLLFLITKLFPPKARKSALIIILSALILNCNFLRAQFLKGSFHTHLDLQMTHLRFDGLMFGCLIKIYEPSLIRIINRKIAGIFLTAGILLYIHFMINGLKLSHWGTLTLAYLAPGFLLVAGLAVSQPLNTILEQKWLVWIGKNSYGIYVWHYIVLVQCVRLPESFTIPSLIVIGIIGSIVMGVVTTATLEKYFLNLRKKLVP